MPNWGLGRRSLIRWVVKISRQDARTPGKQRWVAHLEGRYPWPSEAAAVYERALTDSASADDRERLASYNVSILQAYQALQSLNWRLPAGSTAIANSEVVVDVGQFLSSGAEVGELIISTYGGKPIYLSDVADVIDGFEDTDTTSRFDADVEAA